MADPITITIKSEERAEEILMDAGWSVVRSTKEGVYYVKPGGDNDLKGGVEGIDFVRSLSEALNLALNDEDEV